MKRITLFLFFLGFGFIFAQTFDWAIPIEGAGEDAAEDLVLDAAGNIYMTGHFAGMATFGGTHVVGNGIFEIYLAKYDPNGNLIWLKTAGGSGNDQAFGIALDKQGNVFLGGSFEKTAFFGPLSLTSSGEADAFVAKYDPSGNPLWVKRAGGAGTDHSRGISTDDQGNCYVTGSFEAQADLFGTNFTAIGMGDIFFASLDGSGNHRWSRPAGGTGEDVGMGISTGPSGITFVTGFFYGTSNFMGQSVSSFGSGDAFLVKLTANGNLEWIQKCGGLNGDAGYAVSQDQNGVSFLTGYFTTVANFGVFSLSASGYNDGFIAAYDPGGNCLWADRVGGPDLDICTDVFVDAAGDPYLTGTFKGSAEFGQHFFTGEGKDIFIAKYKQTGELSWAQIAGGPNGDFGQAIAVAGNGSVYTAGYYYFSCVFGNTALPLSNNSDIFLSKLKQGSVGGMEDIGSILISLYPNPSSGTFNISLNKAADADLSLSLHDLSGKEMGKLPVLKAGEKNLRLGLGTLKPGVYGLRLKGTATKGYYKIFIQ